MMRILETNPNEPSGNLDEPDKVQMLRRSIYECPDKGFWKITEKEPGSSHPGACWDVDQEGGQALMYKGTSQQPKRAQYLICYAIIEPSQTNGLDLTTYFRVDEPHKRRMRQVELMHHDRLRGRLTDAEVIVFESVLKDLGGVGHVVKR